VKRIDITGTADLCVTQNENDSNPFNDLATIGKGSISGNSNSGNQSVANGGISNAVYGNSRNGVPGGSIGAGRTEIHHIVEQCQRYKSGFSNAAIQDASNKVALPYSVHRQISGHYSSIQSYTDGKRVRNWLAGQSFEMQTAYGWQIVYKYWG
jgi:hypothetical protein